MKTRVANGKYFIRTQSVFATPTRNDNTVSTKDIVGIYVFT